MWNKTILTELLGIRHPIIQAPMAGASTPELTAAVSNAGGLGSFGAAPLHPDRLRETIRVIRALTDRPFNINVFAAATEQFDRNQRADAAFMGLLTGYHEELGLGELPVPGPLFGPVREQLDVLIEERVPVISFHFGIESEDVERIHTAGLKVICSATTTDEARYLEAAGVDAIIAQGMEAGGHRGSFLPAEEEKLIGTFALLPQIVDAVAVPVIAAGGIMDARGLVACAALGASAAQLGTAFLGCPELNLATAWVKRLNDADASGTTVTSAISGRPARGLRNRYVNEVEALQTTLLPYPLQYSVSRTLRSAASREENPDFMVMWSGQGVGLFNPRPAADIIDDLVETSRVLLQQLLAE